MTAVSALPEAAGPAIVPRRRGPGPRLRRHAVYAGLTTGFAGAVLGSVVAAARAGRLPDRPALGDVLLLGAAAHAVSRVVARERVTSVVRRPFVEHETDGREHPAPEGVRRAVGELVTCPSCLGMWASGAGVVGLAWSPSATRAVATVFAVDAVSDVLHVAYRAARTRA